MLNVCSSNKCPSARCDSAAKVVCSNSDVFGTKTAFLIHVL
jgi:hypothetical protein